MAPKIRKRPAAEPKGGPRQKRRTDERPFEDTKAPLHTLIINLKKRPDRWDKITDRLDDLKLGGKLIVERLNAVDGSAEGFEPDPKEVTSSWKTDRNAKYDGRPGYRRGIELPLSPGELGCMLSHLAAWRRVLELSEAPKSAKAVAEAGVGAVAKVGEEAGVGAEAKVGAEAGEGEGEELEGQEGEAGRSGSSKKTDAQKSEETQGSLEAADSAKTCEREEPVLILEDDAAPTKDFYLTMRKAIDDANKAGADILYLGYIQGAPWRRTIRKGLREAEYLWTTVGYVIWPRGARKLLNELPIDCPVDNWMAWQAASEKVKALAVDPEIVEQEEEWDVGSDVRHSDDAVLEGTV